MHFIEFLFKNGVIPSDKVDVFLESWDRSKSDFVKGLEAHLNIDERSTAILWADYKELPFDDLANFRFINSVDYASFKEISVIPFNVTNEYVFVAIAPFIDYENLKIVEDSILCVEEFRSLKVKYFVSTRNNILKAFSDIESNNSDIFQKIIFDAIRLQASDIHLTPLKDTFNVFFRVDGDLENYKTYNISSFDVLSRSIKVLSNLDISETRRPQSGHFQRGSIDFRVSTHPLIHGENLVIRILNKNKSMISIDNLGFSKDQILYLKKIAKLQKGLIIFCGPTGSGKTTSIYAMLDTMDKVTRNIMTLEDPIEYQIHGIRQTEIRRGVIEFADGVRSILRQDPDVVLIGEIRDEETAKMVIRASMTGHLVITTLHSNDSVGAIARLKELGISDSLIADNLVSVISQRLVKKASQKGRMVICEILKINNALAELISNNASRTQLLQCAIENTDFKNIEDDMKQKIMLGLILDNT